MPHSEKVIPTPTTPAPEVAAPPPLTGLSRIGLATLLLGVLLPAGDFFIVNVALPTIDRDLDASSGMLQLVVAGYGIAYALLLVIGGRLGDTLGRRRLFTCGMAAFTLTSLACGVAPTIGVLVGARVAQGCAAALMLPQVLSTIQATTTGEHRARALAHVGATGAVSTVIGQLLGGLLVAANVAGLGWRPIFLVNVPIGLLGLVLASRTVPDTRSERPLPVDVSGTVLLGTAVLALLIPLTEGRSLSWPAWTIALLVALPFVLAGFAAVERRLEREGTTPLLPLTILRLRSMRTGLLLVLVLYVGNAGFFFVYTLALQDGAHFSALHTGLTVLPMALAFIPAALTTARLVARFGVRVIVGGAALQCIGLLGVLATMASDWPDLHVLALAPGLLLLGFGVGLITPAVFRTVLSEVPVERAGVGSGVLSTMQQVALALGVAAIGSLFLSEAAPARLGSQGATELIFGVLAALAVIIGTLAGRLPHDDQT